MGQPIPRQHPAVVLRSHYRQVRALLAVSMVAIAGLGASVAVLATDGDGADRAVGALTSTPIDPTGSAHGKATPLRAGVRRDGGPDEGTRGPGH